jgi:VanZ family protein
MAAWYRCRSFTTISIIMPTLVTALVFGPSHEKLRYRCAIILYLLILIIGSLPGARADVGEYASGVVLHSAAYAVLTYLLFSGSPGTRLQRALKSVLTIMLMGALDECVQSFFPYRHASAGDWLVDCNAAVMTALVLTLLWPGIQRVVRS